MIANKKAARGTAHRILEAAQNVFVAKGFEGSSINEIAEGAQVNKSLIYHHFGSKEKLWREVKKHILKSQHGEELEQLKFSMASFKDFLTEFVQFRFEIYNKNPDIPRLISWQRLESAQEKLQTKDLAQVSSIIPQIKEFQGRGEIRPDLDPKMVEYLIMNTASAAFMEHPEFMNSSDGKGRYLSMIIDCLHRGLQRTGAHA